MKRFQQYLRYLKPHRWTFLLALILGGLAGAASGFGVPYFTQKVFTRFFEDRETAHTTAELLWVAAQLPLIFLARGVAYYFNQKLLQYLGMRLLQYLRVDLFAKLQRLPMAFFERSRSGDLIARLASDTNQIAATVNNVAKELFLQPFVLIGGVSYLAYNAIKADQAQFLLLLLILAPLIGVPVAIIGRHLKRRSRAVQQGFGRITEVLAENLQAVGEVRAFNLQQAEQARFQRENEDYLRAFMRMLKYYLLSQPILELVSVAAISATFLYAYQAQLGLSVFLALGGALFFTLDAFKRLVRCNNDIQRSEGAFQRIEQVLDEAESVAEPAQPQILPAVRGRVDFDGVDFAYDSGRKVLDDVRATIEPGTVCALVGPSGAGKTTFAKLVLRFYDPAVGSVRLDGVDLRQLRTADLRAAIAYVPQAPFLFNDTVSNNIRIGRPGASDAEVEAAARAAYAHDFIHQLPQGYATVVGENAVRLSGGQRQRLALARAFLRNAPILILDEATSALDSESEVRIQQALAVLVRGKTVFVIAHRFSTIQRADRILLFERGRIEADGRLDELMQHPTFKKLYENQQLDL